MPNYAFFNLCQFYTKSYNFLIYISIAEKFTISFFDYISFCVPFLYLYMFFNWDIFHFLQIFAVFTKSKNKLKFDPIQAMQSFFQLNYLFTIVTVTGFFWCMYMAMI